MNSKKMMTFCACICFSLSLLSQTVGANPPPHIVGDLAEMNRAHDRVSLTNLLGGLFLTEEQVKNLIPLAKAADQIRNKYTESGRQMAKDAASRYDKLVEENIKHPHLLKSQLQEEAQAAHNEFKELKSSYNGELLDLQRKATALLTPSQQKVVSTFKACIVPPRSLKDPTLVGQAASTGEVSRVIDVLRRAPEDLYNKEKAAIAELGLSHVEKRKGTLQKSAREALKKNLIANVDELRAMDDAEYALASHEKINGLLPFDQDTPKDLSKWTPTPVGRFFLAPGAASVLTKWQTARRSSPEDDDKAAQRAALALREQEARERFHNLADLGAAAYKALRREGNLPGWMADVRADVEELARNKEFSKAADAIEKALTRLDKERGGNNDLVVRGLNIRRLVKQKGLSFAVKNKDLDLFGLATKMSNFQRLARAGKVAQANAEGAALESLIKRFKD